MKGFDNIKRNYECLMIMIESLKLINKFFRCFFLFFFNFHFLNIIKSKKTWIKEASIFQL